MTFKVGDKAKCIDPYLNAVRDQVYTVTRHYTSPLGSHFVHLEGLSEGYYADRFVKVNEIPPWRPKDAKESKFVPGSIVRCVNAGLTEFEEGQTYTVSGTSGNFVGIHTYSGMFLQDRFVHQSDYVEPAPKPVIAPVDHHLEKAKELFGL